MTTTVKEEPCEHCLGRGTKPPHDKIGKLMRKKRLAAKLLQQDLAKALHVSTGFVSLLENGKAAWTLTYQTKWKQVTK